jgi:hypothetical protein
MPEEQSQRPGNPGHGLAVRQLNKYLVGQMLGEQERPLLAA